MSLRYARAQCRFILSGPIREALRWAARADLSLRDWAWIDGPKSDLRVYELMTSEAAAERAPLRSWELPAPGEES